MPGFKICLQYSYNGQQFCYHRYRARVCPHSRLTRGGYIHCR